MSQQIETLDDSFAVPSTARSTCLLVSDCSGWQDGRCTLPCCARCQVGQGQCQPSRRGPCPCSASVETGPRPEPPGRGPRRDYSTVCPETQDGQHVWTLDFRCSNTSVLHYRCACGAMGYRDKKREKGHDEVRQFAPDSKRMKHAKRWAERQELRPPTITALATAGSSSSGGFKPGGCRGSKWRG